MTGGGCYDEKFWLEDLQRLVLRMSLLKKYDCLPYVMRFEKYRDSPYKSAYVDLAAFGNQPQFFMKMPLDQFCHQHRNGHIQHPRLVQFLKNLLEE